jgi:ADP-ribose pyrophosphatase YjhB (NUDIX family)
MKQTIIAAGGIVTNEKNEILFIFRRNKWDLPKGKLDPNEKIEDCAVREVMEETGLQNVQLGKHIGNTYHEYYDKYVQADVIKACYWYAMKTTSAEKLIPQTEEDITAIEWITQQELPHCLQNTYPNIIEIITKWQSE